MPQNNFVKKIREISAVSSRTEKEQIIATFNEDEQKLTEYALSLFKVFGVKQITKPKTFGNNTDLTPFMDLLEKLSNRVLTGNAAKTEVTKVLASYPEDYYDILSKVVKKNLKCGASAKTFNKYFTHQIPVFYVKACLKRDNDHIQKVPCIVEPKYDGERCIIFYNSISDTIIHYSKRGKPIKQLTAHPELLDNIRKELKLFTEKYKSVSNHLVFDGEIFGVNFKYTSKAKKPTNCAKYLKYYIFDVITINDWYNKISSLTLDKRKKLISDNFASSNYSYIEEVEYKVLDTIDECDKLYEHYCKEGFEGVIYKQLNSYYEVHDKRTPDWIKHKPIIDLDLYVYDVFDSVEEPNKIGGLLVKGYDENGKFIDSKIGTGFTDEQLTSWFINKKLIVGKVVKLEIQELSLNDDDDDEENPIYKIRFGAYKGIRTDKTKDDVLNYKF